MMEGDAPTPRKSSKFLRLALFWRNFRTRTRILTGRRSNHPDRAHPTGEVLVIAVLTAKVREIDVSRHVRRLLRRRPVREVIGDVAVTKITASHGFQIAVHQRELISRWQEPASDPVETEIRAQGSGGARLCARSQPVGGHLVSRSHGTTARPRN